MGQGTNLTDPVSAQVLLARAAQRLAGIESAALDAQLLLAAVTQRTRAFLFAHPEFAVPPAQALQFEALLTRRATGEPLAYLTGEREFWSLPLHVTPAVLIPRPETELAVERCLALIPERQALVADLGTGSGAIALALAHECPRWHLFATDRSSAALDVARDNARRLAITNIEFVEGDWLAPVAGRRFDLIVSNPPYIDQHDPVLPTLRFEPSSALSAGPGGMDDLGHIIPDALACLRPGGWLVLEHGADQAATVARALVAAGYARVRCHCDLAGRERVSEAQRP